MADHPNTEPTTTAAGRPALTGQYEQLRQAALAGHAEGWRHGLGVLTTRGMTGWMRACQTTPPPPPPAPSAPAPATAEGLDGNAGELVAVLAAMALAHA